MARHFGLLDTLGRIRKEMPVKKSYAWRGDPKIGWWASKNSIMLYHGTHYSRVEHILNTGIKAPKSGPTADWVSLALEPNTAFGYASMGGESDFRAAKGKAISIPPGERVVLVVKMSLRYILKNMEKDFRGNIPETRDRLTNKEKYENWKKSDQEYYALTEIRFPKVVMPNHILGYMVK
jgi:hypothetical protein